MADGSRKSLLSAERVVQTFSSLVKFAVDEWNLSNNEFRFPYFFIHLTLVALLILYLIKTSLRIQLVCCEGHFNPKKISYTFGKIHLSPKKMHKNPEKSFFSKRISYAFRMSECPTVSIVRELVSTDIESALLCQKGVC